MSRYYQQMLPVRSVDFWREFDPWHKDGYELLQIITENFRDGTPGQIWTGIVYKEQS